MRVVAAIAALMAMAILTATVQASKQGIYEGHVKGARNSEVTMKVDRSKGEERLEVVRFHAKRVPTDCAGTSDTANYGVVNVGIKLEKGGRFHGEDSASGFRDDNLFVVHGRIKGDGTAKGTLQIIEDFDGIPDCNTGRVRWIASK
jgi:hypothetical protein